MVRVAVAGGTAGIGRTVVEAIVTTGKHDVFVLSRNVSTTLYPIMSLVCVDYSRTPISLMLKPQ